jgi:heme exporter protein C
VKSGRGLRLLAAGAAAATAVALLMAVRAPDERVMGGNVKIVFVHAGAAWTAYVAYALAALGGLAYLVTRRRRWDRLALASAEWGVVLTSVTLVTGSLFGRATSNWWWNWGDVRLVVTLLLWFLYAAYLTLRQFVPGDAGRVASAVLALVGVPVMLLNHFAVTLWQRSHPPSVVLRPGGPAMDESLLVPLAVAQVAYLLVFAAVLLARVELERWRETEEVPSRAGYQP